ncbi:MAG: response regulator transcription factor [Kiritimatiellia bacterium]|jgi:DNA-binding NarL/FixJ family response regulator|nr:response regulator transcription factor [Kiritimatiellia bacterium]MDP6630386.1 response regulator transcription factor [Kiritimatiellia bacterium]MDP6809843.1 response regulator transcription factor [Kiritimatiellia bacterium]MDP7024235.1 response regulator transcription factor [Kiritimatiellia bacterium]
MKHEATAKLLEAIRTVRDGSVYLSADMRKRMLNRFTPGSTPSDSSPVESLSDRELQVFQAVAEGMSTKEIAAQLGLSVKTVEGYKGRVQQKLDVHGTAQLTRYAVKWLDGTL